MEEISTPLEVGHLFPVPQVPKFKIPLSRSFVPGPIEYSCHVSSMSAQQSWSFRVLKVLTLHGCVDGGTDERTDGQLTSHLDCSEWHTGSICRGTHPRHMDIQSIQIDRISGLRWLTIELLWTQFCGRSMVSVIVVRQGRRTKNNQPFPVQLLGKDRQRADVESSADVSAWLGGTFTAQDWTSSGHHTLPVCHAYFCHF